MRGLSLRANADALFENQNLMNQQKKGRSFFTPEEIRAFKFHAVIIVGIAFGLYLVALKRIGQGLGVLFAAALLPLPPVVIYLVRRCRAGR